jgi:hypothetical protein
MEASTTHFTSFGHFDFSDFRAMKRENTLDAFSVGNLADGKRFIDAAAFAGNDNACEELDTFFVTFDNAGVNFDGVAYIAIRNGWWMKLVDTAQSCFSAMTWWEAVSIGYSWPQVVAVD